MRYYSDKLGRIFNTEDALFKAERAADKEKEEVSAKEAAVKAEHEKLLNETVRAKHKADEAEKEAAASKKAYYEAVKKLQAFEVDKCAPIDMGNYDSIFDFISDLADRLNTFGLARY